MEFHFAEEFSGFPFGRYKKDDKYSGEALRELLADRFRQAQAKGEPLEIVLDGVHGLSGEFMDESFGKFAEQLKDEQGVFLTREILRFRGDAPHYESYIRSIWNRINKYYPPEKRIDIPYERDRPVRDFFQEIFGIRKKGVRL